MKRRLARAAPALFALLTCVSAGATALQSGTLADVLALPGATGTIGGTTFAFNISLNGIPVYYAGPWAGEGTWGPASAITFTPDTSASGDPVFTLAGNFHAPVGQLYDVSLSYFNVTAPAGMLIDSVTVQIVNPVGNAASYQNNVSLNSCYAYAGQLSSTCASTGEQSAEFGIDLRFWNQSASAVPVGFDAAVFTFHEVPAVPEPAPALLFTPGLALLALWRRRALGAGAPARR